MGSDLVSITGTRSNARSRRDHNNNNNPSKHLHRAAALIAEARCALRRAVRDLDESTAHERRGRSWREPVQW